jgi:hypothetical protein
MVIGEHIGDDDLSCRMVMRHSFQELIDAGKMALAQWPHYEGETKAKKPDDGLLLVNNPLTNFRANKGHQVRHYSKFFFVGMALKPKKDKKGCTSIDTTMDEMPNELDTLASCWWHLQGIQ